MNKFPTTWSYKYPYMLILLNYSLFLVHKRGISYKIISFSFQKQSGGHFCLFQFWLIFQGNHNNFVSRSCEVALLDRSGPREVFYEKVFSAKTKTKKRNRETPVPEVCNFIKKETLAQLFSCESCEISKNNFFTEHLQRSAS